MKVAVVSAVFGRYDEPVFVEQTVPCEYVLVTDGDCLVPEGWDQRITNPGEMDPRLAAKSPKCCPWEFADADVFVWLDGSIEPRADLVESMLESLGDDDIAFYTHPHRSSIISEARASRPLRKYSGQDVMAQAVHYLSEGHPDAWGLWAAGLFVLRDTDRTRLLGRRWIEEIQRWTLQDQISLPVVLREVGLWPASLHGSQLGNPLFRIRRHTDGS
jgi:hypothetical protein